MEKADNIQTSSAALKSDGGTEKKIVLNFNTALIIKCLICGLLGFTSVFSGMRPFSLGFYTAMFSADSWALCFVSAAIGSFAADAATAWVYAASLVMTTAALALIEQKDNLIIRCVCCGAFFAVFKLAYIAVDGFSVFAVLAVILELLLLIGSVVITHYGYSLFINPGKRTFISTFEKLCTFAFAALVILSLGGINISDRVNLSSVAAVLYIYILCSCASPENAAVFGIIMGVIVAMNYHPATDVAGTYAFGALLASIFAGYKKPGVVFGFTLASTAFSLLISDYSRIYSGIAESLIAAIIYVFLPGRVITYFSSLFSKSAPAYDAISLRQKIRKDDFSALKKMSESFRELSGIYLSCARDKSFGRGYMISKFSAVSQKVCASCHLQRKCFDSKNKNSLDNMTALFEKSLKNGKLNVSDLPSPMRDVCHRKDSFTEAFNFMLELVRTEKRWLGKINESRRLVSDQLSGVADSIDRICEEESMHLNPSLEETLRAALDKNSVYPLGVSAYTDSRGSFSIYVSFREGYITPKAKEITERCIDSAVYAKSRFVSASRNGGEITYLYCPQRKYSASFGYASKAKHGEKVSGDSFNVIAPDKKSVVMALSDGMGSGREAKAESETAIRLLEKFMNAGFDSDTAVRLINSSLLLKSSRDSFATIDICSINLSEHCLVFTKLGAANAYIKSRDGVSVVRGRNLPAGILREIEIEKHMLPIDSDTVIVLLSDGVGDTAIKSAENEGWIEKELEKLSTRNPQIIAAKLLEAAYKLENKTPSDDMTVLVACIYDSDEKV